MLVEAFATEQKTNIYKQKTELLLHMLLSKRMTKQMLRQTIIILYAATVIYKAL